MNFGSLIELGIYSTHQRKFVCQIIRPLAAFFGWIKMCSLVEPKTPMNILRKRKKLEIKKHMQRYHANYTLIRLLLEYGDHKVFSESINTGLQCLLLSLISFLS